MAKTEEQRAEYFDEEGKQLKPLPLKWLDLSKRFKVGDKIRYLRSNTVHISSAECKAKSHFHYRNENREKCEDRQMLGMIGVVLQVNQGDGRCWPPRWVRDDSDEGGVWLNQRAGWLTVQYPVSNHRNGKGEYQPLAMHIELEGIDWEKVD